MQAAARARFRVILSSSDEPLSHRERGWGEGMERLS
jgi:hypothetical protein